jgi:hypothetical protein
MMSSATVAMLVELGEVAGEEEVPVVGAISSWRRAMCGLRATVAADDADVVPHEAADSSNFG